MCEAYLDCFTEYIARLAHSVGGIDFGDLDAQDVVVSNLDRLCP